jgi:hypothetical protein
MAGQGRGRAANGCAIMDQDGGGASLRSSRPPAAPVLAPDISPTGSCYGPVILPVNLLAPRMNVFFEATGNKCLFAAKPTGIARSFFLFSPFWTKYPPAVAVHGIRRQHNADNSRDGLQG